MPKFLEKRAVDPFGFIRRVTEELDRAFGTGPEFTETTSRIWSPELEVFERDDTFLVRIDLPGLKKEDVKIQVTHDELTIEGERKVEKEVKKEGFYRTERAYGTFFRRIGLPEHVKAENAVANFKDGVLEIEMPSIPVPETTKRTVEIKG